MPPFLPSSLGKKEGSSSCQERLLGRGRCGHPGARALAFFFLAPTLPDYLSRSSFLYTVNWEAILHPTSGRTLKFGVNSLYLRIFHFMLRFTH